MNKQEFYESIKEFNIEITDDKIAQVDKYIDFLIQYNTHTNLTSIKDKDDIYLKHFYDSLTILKSIDLNEYKTLLDVGSGAGFPGIVIKIFFPHLDVTLLDSNNKKITFLNQVIELLQLSNIKTIHTRAEEYAHQNPDKYDIVTARAVSSLPMLAELCLPLTKINGYFIALKGDSSDEIEQASDIISKLNAVIVDIKKFNLPIEDSRRAIIKIQKKSATPKGYPRRYDQIKKALKNKRK